MNHSSGLPLEESKEEAFVYRLQSPIGPKLPHGGVNFHSLCGTHMRVEWVPVGSSEHNIQNHGTGNERCRACLRGGTCVRPAEACLGMVSMAMEERKG